MEGVTKVLDQELVADLAVTAPDSGRRMADRKRPAEASANDDMVPAAKSPADADHHLVLAQLQPALEELGLNGNQARVLLALLQLGSASATQLARLSGVLRTNVYPVLNELAEKGLIGQVPGKSAVWVSPGEEEVIERLHAAQQERMKKLESTVGHARQLLSQLSTAIPSAALPYVHLIQSAAQNKAVFEKNITQTQRELLMFTRPPSSWPYGSVNPVVIDLLRRGVETRALYQASDVESPENRLLRQEWEEYHAAGVEGRVIDELPMKLAIFDRRVAFIALNNPVLPDVGYPTTVLVEHPGFAGILADGFEARFAAGIPYDSFVAERLSGTPFGN